MAFKCSWRALNLKKFKVRSLKSSKHSVNLALLKFLRTYSEHFFP